MLLKTKLFLTINFAIVLLLSCKDKTPHIKKKAEVIVTEAKQKSTVIKDTFKYKKDYLATTFDFPVGKPGAKGYYNAQGFGKNNHLGDDWNGVNGGNSDLGDPIYAVGNGYISSAKDLEGGWGNVIRIIHKLYNGKEIESLYAHCDTILVKPKQWIKKGEQIGTIGNANGTYLAHLHLEIRDSINLSIGAGYSENTAGYLDPTKFIKDHRK